MHYTFIPLSNINYISVKSHAVFWKKRDKTPHIWCLYFLTFLLSTTKANAHLWEYVVGWQQSNIKQGTHMFPPFAILFVTAPLLGDQLPRQFSWCCWNAFCRCFVDIMHRFQKAELPSAQSSISSLFSLTTQHPVICSGFLLYKIITNIIIQVNACTLNT